MPRDLIGAWRLETMRRFRDGAFDRETMGAGALGRLMYDENGVMSAFLMAKAFKAGETPQTWDQFLSYSAHWSLAEDGRSVTHNVDFCSIPAMIGAPLVRYVSWDSDDAMTLTTASFANKAGERVHDELLWHRILSW